MFSPDGRISEQGCFEELRIEEGVMNHLLTHHHGLEDLPDTSVETPHSAIKQATPTSRIPSSEELDLKRQTGDLKLYSYYYHSIGARYALTFLVLATAYIFFGKLPRKLLHILSCLYSVGY